MDTDFNICLIFDDIIYENGSQELIFSELTGLFKKIQKLQAYKNTFNLLLVFFSRLLLANKCRNECLKVKQRTACHTKS